jgi:exonuclease SbcC
VNQLPIQRLMVSDFRRIEGTRELPFDAPVVLIHGPNGTGKTSILSALELALTGRIRSMERQSDRYRAHLPFFGQSYATVRADVAANLQAGTPGMPLTVNGARLEGTPALDEAAARFYAERCYLDQSSLGRLLDLYQAREGAEETALEIFVNELLGLEKLDALRDGLGDALDFRLLKKLAPGADEADREAKAVSIQLKEQSSLRAELRAETEAARTTTRGVVSALRSEPADGMRDDELLEFIRASVEDDEPDLAAKEANTVLNDLIALGGRVAAMEQRPTHQRLVDAQAELESATIEWKNWSHADGEKVRAWDADAADAGAHLHSDPATSVAHAAAVARRELDNQARLRAQADAIALQLAADRAELDKLQLQLANANELSSALVEGLAALRDSVEDTNVCPVCDRDYAEVSANSLLHHIDAKLAKLTAHSDELVDLRNRLNTQMATVSRVETENSGVIARLLSERDLDALTQRHATLLELAARAEAIDSARSYGAHLEERVLALKQHLEDLQASMSENAHVHGELARYATLLRSPLTADDASPQTLLEALLAKAGEEVDRLTSVVDLRQRAEYEAIQFRSALGRESHAVQRLADLAEQKKTWDDRVSEAKRRQGVAKGVLDAATEARTAIVQRVFTESLNDVWKAVFTRLAPDEGFIPSFGIPSATRKTFDIKLETTHRSGAASGPPQMMLSAGNLNTAALSLFLALHLAVDPIVPCLVFDDPVQAMDEVHVAQFAALIRLLSKRNGRQVVIAVHDRELFDYLALELSPAFESDELITIELGAREVDEDRGIVRHSWAPDAAIAS